MMQHWTKLYTTHNYTEASIIKGMLEENSIPVTVFNRQASPYAGIGMILKFMWPNSLKTLRKV